MLGQYVNDSLGINTNCYDRYIQKNQVILKFFSFDSGKIKAIRNIEKIQKKPKVLKYRIAVSPGDEIKPITTDANRHGFIILKANGDIQSESIEIINQLEVVYE